MKKTKSSKKIVLKITMSMTTRSVKGRVALTGVGSTKTHPGPSGGHVKTYDEKDKSAGRVIPI